MPSRRASAHAFLAVSVLALAACGRATGAADAEASASESAVPVSSPIDGDPLPSFITWDGEVPVWPLTWADTESILLNFDWGYSDDGGAAWRAANGFPETCNPSDGGHEPPFDECVGKALADAGVGADARRLFQEHSLTIFALDGTGPVKVADLYDWTYYGSNGTNPDMIVTPRGIMAAWVTWTARIQAFDEAYATDSFQRILTATDPEGYGLSFAQYGGQTDVFGSPEQTDAGWTVPFTTRLAGCHACITVFAGEFAVDFTAEGAPSGMRFLGFCAYPDTPTRPIQGDPAMISALAAELPACPA